MFEPKGGRFALYEVCVPAENKYRTLQNATVQEKKLYNIYEFGKKRLEYLTEVYYKVGLG